MKRLLAGSLIALTLGASTLAQGSVATSHRVAVFCKAGLWNYPSAQQVRLIDFRSDAYRVQAFYVCDAGRIIAGPWVQHEATVWTHAPTLAEDAAAHIAMRKWNNGRPIYRTLSNGF
jgi:hypothetical protein